MRLTNEQRQIIREEVAQTFGPTAEVRLFGSRTDDTTRGGDIDLHIEARGNPATLLDKELTLYARLQRRLGEQHIDIVVHGQDQSPRPIDTRAHETGTRL